MSGQPAAQGAILDVSTRMLALARAGEWTEMASLDAERQRLLASLPMTAMSVGDTLSTLLAHNEEMRTLATEARSQAGEALDQHQQRHRALSTYLHVGID
jgi:flagellar protein FliT